MLYQITVRFRGSPDGAHVYTYERGDIVPNPEKPFSDSLADVALRNQWARKKRPQAPPTTPNGRRLINSC